MTRRFFIFTLACSSALIAGSTFTKRPEVWDIINQVQMHLFPGTATLPSADDVEATRYLKFVSKDPSFPKQNLAFILEGAKKLDAQSDFIQVGKMQREQILASFIESQYGKNWVSMLLNYTLEAFFCDPIYGGNAKQKGWKAYHHFPGMPRPVKKFGKEDG